MEAGSSSRSSESFCLRGISAAGEAITSSTPLLRNSAFVVSSLLPSTASKAPLTIWPHTAATRAEPCDDDADADADADASTSEEDHRRITRSRMAASIVVNETSGSGVPR